MSEPGELLRSYGSERSERAFTEFVQRHLNLVYFTALRRTGDDRVAEEVAQEVFTAVARQATTLASHPNVVAWLYRTTRNVAEKARRSEHRRRHREQEAHLMQDDSTASSPVDWEAVRPFIDRALDELSEVDREAVVLRFFANQPYASIASVLGSTEDAARMRVDRALEKLHAALRRHGLKSTQAALGLALTHQATLAAPAALAGKISGAVLSQVALTTAGTTVATTTLAAMTTAKTLTLITAAAVITTLSITAYVHERGRSKKIETALATLSKDRDYLESKVEELTVLMTESRKREIAAAAATPPPKVVVATPSPTPATKAEEPPVPGVTRTAPKGWFKNGSKTNAYTVGVDQNQSFRGMPSAYAQATDSTDHDFGGMMQTISSQNYAGQRVRMSGWMKTEDAAKGGNLWLRVDAEGRSGVQFDNMADRAPKGTTDWREYSIVLDVPVDAKSLSYGFFLGGNGKVWVSGTKLEAVGPEVPSTNKAKAPALNTQPVNLGFGGP